MRSRTSTMMTLISSVKERETNAARDVLFLRAAERTTDFVTDIVTNSDDVSLIVPVYEGYALSRVILRLFGRGLAEHLTKILTECECSFPDIVELKYDRHNIENLCFIRKHYDTELKSTTEIDKEKNYELPVVNIIITVDAKRFHYAEVLLQTCFSDK